MEKTNVYSPNQVLLGSFFGGPVASTVMLKRNFASMGESAAARKTLVRGAILSIVLIGVVVILPTSASNVVLPLLYSFAARWIAERYQLPKQAIAESDRYAFRSNLDVAAVSAASLVASVAVVFSGIAFLILTGLVR